MDFYVYILWSNSIEKFYIGSTENLIKRVQSHNKGLGNWTRKAHDWILVHSISQYSRSEALELEKRIKKRGAKRWLEDKGLKGLIDVAQSG